jgi:prepilin peptidase CpaA
MLLIAPIPLLAAAIVALAAVVTDLRARRIPNWLTLSSMLLALVAYSVFGGVANGGTGALAGAATSVVGAALGFALLLPLYLIRLPGLGRAMGAGDVKLLAAIGAIAGPNALQSIAFYTALAGAAQAVIILAGQGRLSLLLHQSMSLQRTPLSGVKAPYALAIAAGVLLSMVLPPITHL